MKIGILGGGLAGLSVAAHLKVECEVLERDCRVGGHCQSITEQGFTYDAGGPHIIFSRDGSMVEYMVRLLGDNVLRRRRNNKIFYKGRYVRYPFENGLGDLDPQDRFECLYHYLENDSPQPTNFKEWIYHTFGKGIAEKYLVPYNEKIWKIRAEEMALDWVEGRVPKPPIEDVIKAAVGVETEGYTHQLFYHYPARGGIEALPKALAARISGISTEFEVRRIWKEGGHWNVAGGGQTRRYAKVVATIPLPELVRIVDGVPAEVIAAVDRLRYNSLITVSLGLATDRLPDYTAIYVPDPEIVFHRVSFPAVFSPNNAPAGQSVIQAEITVIPGDGFWELGDETITDRVIADLETMRLLRRSDVCYLRLLRTRYGYVLQDFGYRKNLELAKAYFDSVGIPLCGRVAEFEYINMDVCIQRGMRLAEILQD